MPTQPFRPMKRPAGAEARSSTERTAGLGPVAKSDPPRLSPESLRAVYKAASRYFLRAVMSGADTSGGDIIAAAVAVAISDGNIGHIDADPALARRFANFDQPPPDDMRRPISALSIARRLKLPRETVRRRVKALIAAKRCVRTPTGVYIPTAILASREHEANSELVLTAIRRLLRDLERYAPDGEWPRASPDTPAIGSVEKPPLRLVMRRSACLAVAIMADLAHTVGGYDEALVYMAVVNATAREGKYEGPRFIHGLRIADSLALPGETVRRRLVNLTRAQYIHRTEAGYTAIQHPRHDEALIGVAVATAHHTRLMFADLARLGVNLG